MSDIKNFINFDYKVICEIGVFMPDSVQCKDLIDDKIETIFVEANPVCVTELSKLYKTPNIKIFNKAIGDSEGPVKLYTRGNQDPSAFIETVPFSPLLVNENFVPDENYIMCESIRFDTIDPGDIDILCLDIEGAEWYALKHMISRPKLIAIEMYGGNYINPFKLEIEGWMKENQYKPIHHGLNDIYYSLI
jgi:FkbM family methyltransferase